MRREGFYKVREWRMDYTDTNARNSSMPMFDLQRAVVCFVLLLVCVCVRLCMYSLPLANGS